MMLAFDNADIENVVIVDRERKALLARQKATLDHAGLPSTFS